MKESKDGRVVRYINTISPLLKTPSDLSPDDHHLPIALCDDKYSCTEDPIAHFISFNRLHHTYCSIPLLCLLSHYPL